MLGLLIVFLIASILPFFLRFSPSSFRYIHDENPTLYQRYTIGDTWSSKCKRGVGEGVILAKCLKFYLVVLIIVFKLIVPILDLIISISYTTDYEDVFVSSSVADIPLSNTHISGGV